MKIQLSEFEIAYTDEGSGPPILFVHGYPLNRRMWLPQIEGLQDQFRVLAPDLRGHGETSPTPGPYSIDQLADDLAAFLDAIDIREKISLCGLSMGGYVCLAFVRRHSDRLKNLILTATRASADTPDTKLNRDRTANLARSEGVATVVEGMLPRLFTPENYAGRGELVRSVREMMLQTSLEGMLGALIAMKNRPDYNGALAELKTPCLVIHGQADQIVPLTEAEAMAGSIPGCKFRILPAAGHLPNLEQPELFNLALKSFL